MKISEPMELKDKGLTISNLSQLEFIEIERINDEAIIKVKLSGRFSKLREWLDKGWIGQIIKDRGNGKYYFLGESGNLKDVFKLDDWDKIKQVMGCLI